MCSSGCLLVGHWRIFDADVCTADHLDAAAPAVLVIGPDGQGKIAFGGTQGDLQLDYGCANVFFTWAGFCGTDEAYGFGSAKLLVDGQLEIEFSYQFGGEVLLKAAPEKHELPPPDLRVSDVPAKWTRKS